MSIGNLTETKTVCVYFPDLNLFNLESLSQLVIEHGLRLNRNKWLASIQEGEWYFKLHLERSFDFKTLREEQFN